MNDYTYGQMLLQDMENAKQKKKPPPKNCLIAKKCELENLQNNKWNRTIRQRKLQEELKKIQKQIGSYKKSKSKKYISGIAFNRGKQLESAIEKLKREMEILSQRIAAEEQSR